MTVFLVVLHVMVCLVLIVVVLLQRGKGAEIGAVFGGGASTTVFGSRGAGNFLTKLTTASAIVFMLTSLTLSYIANTRSTRSIFEEGAEPGPAPGQQGLPFSEIPGGEGAGAEATAPSETPAPATPEAPPPAESPAAP